MSTYVVRARAGRRGGDTLLGVKISRELAREIVKAHDCQLIHFQPATLRYPMTLVCEAEDNQKIAKVLRGLDVFGYGDAEVAKIAKAAKSCGACIIWPTLQKLNARSGDSISRETSTLFGRIAGKEMPRDNDYKSQKVGNGC